LKRSPQQEEEEVDSDMRSVPDLKTIIVIAPLSHIRMHQTTDINTVEIMSTTLLVSFTQWHFTEAFW